LFPSLFPYCADLAPDMCAWFACYFGLFVIVLLDSTSARCRCHGEWLNERVGA
jgi:hypothetical protein